ncbi:MAG TPA: hypothetical protein VK623_08630 [Flavobacterium sp.]|nr:hypothetical protein [Flavobacterium sp.]
MDQQATHEDLMQEFGYIIDKIKSAPFVEKPFKHLLMMDFLSDDHFQQVIKAEEVNRPPYKTTEELIEGLTETGYQITQFPGCTTSKEEYLKAYNSKKWPVDESMEGFGLTMRLRKIETPLLSRLITFLNSDIFATTLKEKFGVETDNKINTSVQKYLHAYEISPHPDERNKALTYLLNINTNPESENLQMHTSLLEFKPERRYIYDFWKYNTKVERCWVPWSWCNKVVETNKNNCFVIFTPANDTLHGIKLNYDHLKYQRTQIYGNLFYKTNPSEVWNHYNDIDLLKTKPTFRSKVKAMLPEAVVKMLR